MVEECPCVADVDERPKKEVGACLVGVVGVHPTLTLELNMALVSDLNYFDAIFLRKSSGGPKPSNLWPDSQVCIALKEQELSSTNFRSVEGHRRRTTDTSRQKLLQILL